MKQIKNYIKNTNSKATPQNLPIPGREAEMARNNAGGFTFVADEFSQLRRFLILGSESNTYYQTAQKLTEQNAKNVLAAIKKDGQLVVNIVVEISEAGRAPKNDFALFVLALVLTHGDTESKRAAASAISRVARIGTHILHLAEYVNGLRSWGRLVRNGFAAWYNGHTPLELAKQITKYANRDGWTHGDILRLSHARPATPSHDALFTHAVGKAKSVEIDTDVAEYMAAVDEVKTADVKTVVKLIAQYKLPREVLPTEMLTKKEIWEALLPHMGMEALVRNLATLTRVGIIAPLGTNVTVFEKLGNAETVQKSRIHPIKVLTALLTYKAGRGQRGSHTWTPNAQVLDALDAMFYMSFKNVVPTNKRILVALDVSGSMAMGDIAGVLGLSPRLASAAMALLVAKTERNFYFSAFSTSFRSLNIGARDNLESVLRTISGLPFEGTDCSLPMIWAEQQKVEVDAFYVYTDNETWAGRVQPSQALKQYRSKMGIDSKLVVVGLSAEKFTIADPQDTGMLDVVGFDSAAPAVMADFIRGEF
jgi:60 kDa SS-A/Ro ribonucleoprotein